MNLRALMFVLAAALAAPACGSLPRGKLPVDNQLKEFEPPEEEDVAGEEGDEEGDEEADEAEVSAGQGSAEAAGVAAGG